MRHHHGRLQGLVPLLLVLVASCDETTGPQPDPLPEEETHHTAAPLHIQGGVGAKNQNIWIHQGGSDIADGVSGAEVTVNDVVIPGTAFAGHYSGELPDTVPIGSPLHLEVSAHELVVEATGTVPEAPVLTAPAAESVFTADDSIPVRWTSETDPDRFRVYVNTKQPVWYRELPGTARELVIDVRELPQGRELVIGVVAYNDGAFSGPASADSRMGIMMVGDPRLITIEAAPLLIMGGVGAHSENIWLCQGGVDIADGVSGAVVTVNGVSIPNVGGRLYPGYYSGELPDTVPPGSPLHLRVSARGLVVEATGSVPDVPVLTAPADSGVASGDAIPVRWTSATDPDRFRVYVNTNQPVWYRELPGTARELAIPVNELPAGQELVIGVAAYNDGSFSGPAHPDSRMGTMTVSEPISITR